MNSSKKMSAVEELNDAVRRGDAKLVEQLIQNGVDPNQISREGDSPLLLACLSGHTDLVKLLLNELRKAPDSTRNKIYHCTLRLVVSSEHLEHEMIMKVTQELLASKMQLDYTESYDLLEGEVSCTTTMELACKQGNVELVQLLLPHAKWDDMSFTRKVFSQLVESGHTELVKLLLEQIHSSSPSPGVDDNSVSSPGVDDNSVSSPGVDDNSVSSPGVDNSVITCMLWKACGLQTENVELVKLLLKKYPKSVNQKSNVNDGWFPLMIASARGHNKVIEILLEKKAKINIQSSGEMGDTALIVAAEGCKSETVKFLCERGAKVNIANKKGKTALLIVMEKLKYHPPQDTYDNYMEVLQELCEGGANVNLQDDAGHTPLMNAITLGEERSVAVVKLLLKHKAKIDKCNNLGHHPLHLAIKQGASSTSINEIPKLLLDSDPSAVNQTNGKGETPLMVACENERLEMCGLLLDKDKEPDVNMRDKSGKYALLHAVGIAKRYCDMRKSQHLSAHSCTQEEENLKIIEKLLARGAKASITATRSSAQSILRKIASSLIVRISESKFPKLWALLKPIVGDMGEASATSTGSKRIRSAYKASSEQPLEKRLRLVSPQAVQSHAMDCSPTPSHAPEHSPPNPDPCGLGLISVQDQHKNEYQPAVNTTPIPEFPSNQRCTEEPPIGDCLRVMKYMKQNGEEGKFNLKKKTSSKWHEIGTEFRIEQNTLDGWRTQHQGKSEACWMEVMNQWLENGARRYPVQWNSLYEVLEDLNMSEVAKELKNAVENSL